MLLKLPLIRGEVRLWGESVPDIIDYIIITSLHLHTIVSSRLQFVTSREA